MGGTKTNKTIGWSPPFLREKSLDGCRVCVFLSVSLVLSSAGVHAGPDERLHDVSELSGEGALQVLQDGADHVLRRLMAGGETRF